MAVLDNLNDERIDRINSNLDNIMNVDVDEKIVGTWDGLPIYERLFRGVIDPTKTSTIISSAYNCTNIQLISAFGEVKASSGSKLQLGCHLNADSYTGLYVSGTSLLIYHNTGFADYHITVRYVKLKK